MNIRLRIKTGSIDENTLIQPHVSAELQTVSLRVSYRFG